MTGRPSAFTEDIGDLICALLMEGKSLRQICSMDNMPVKSTVLLWVVKGERGDEKYKTFSDQYLRAREAQAYGYLDEVVDIADYKGGDIKRDSSGNIVFDDTGNPIIDHDNIQRAKLQIEARFRYGAKMHPRRLGDKIDMNLGGQHGENPVNASLEVSFVKPAS